MFLKKEMNFYLFQTFISSYRITNAKEEQAFYAERLGNEETVYFGMKVVN
jgi:hypothetical protein